MLSFLRNDLNQLHAYAPHPGGNSGSPIETQILDRLDTNECPYDLPEELNKSWRGRINMKLKLIVIPMVVIFR
jgi:histidinol phosphate aminotransferase apoenzyme (EC 2.6.1.9)